MAEDITNNGDGGVSGVPGASETPASADWLPADVRASYPGASRFKDVGALVKSWDEGQRMIGRMGTDRVKIPTEYSTQSERDAFYARIGRPESPDRYDLALRDDAPVNRQMVDSFRAVAHGLGITQEQAKGLLSWYSEQASGQTAALDEFNREGERALREEWGYAYDRNVATAQRAVVQLVDGNIDHPLVALLDATKLGDSPVMIRLFHEIAKLLPQDSEWVDGDHDYTGNVSADAARDRIAAIRAQKGWDKNAEAQAELTRLYPVAYPEPERG